MTLLELRKKIDMAIAEMGGETVVESRNRAGDLSPTDAVMLMRTRYASSIVLDTDDDLVHFRHAEKSY